jgi:hypothetical protein
MQFNASNCRRRWNRQTVFILSLYFHHAFLDVPDCFSFLTLHIYQGYENTLLTAILYLRGYHMPLLLVTFDPNKPGQKNLDLLNEIKSYSNVRLSDSSYAIITDKTPGEVCEEMKSFIDTGDSIYIINLKRPYKAFGSELVSDWLKKELRD